ncbi:MAG: DUF695 domain-containing protein [Bacteroidota bacterium]
MNPYTEWDFYFCTIEERPASIMLDLALIESAPVADQTEFVQVAIQLNQPNEYGLTTQGEAEVLYVLEDRLAEHMAENLGAVYVGRNTHHGSRTFYFYAKSSVDVDAVVEEVMDSFTDHRYTCEAVSDPEWTFYQQFLYPSHMEYQSILNRRVIEKLEAQGVALSESREVEHFLYFKSESSRSVFLERIKGENFQINQQYQSETNTELPFKLVLSRKDRMEPHTIDAVVMFLAQLAEECQGEYDGWGTGVVLTE